MKNKIDKILRWFVALIFIYAAISKIIDPAQFAEEIDNYRLLPYMFVPLIAIILPWIELFCGLCILTNKLSKGSILLLLVLTNIFLLAISSALIRDLDISCGCFVAPGDWNKISFVRLIEDIILLSFVLFIYINNIKTLNHNDIDTKHFI